MKSRWLLVWLVSLLMLAPACRRAPRPVGEVVAVPAAQLPVDPLDKAWHGAPEHVARLLLQDLVEPRLTTASTPEVRIRALGSGTEVAFRLAWADATVDDRADSGRFADACAVQLPKTPGPEPPDPQMGNAGSPVEVSYWRADWQAWVDGRSDSIRELHPNASVDHYPFEAFPLEPGSPAQREMALLYSPAAALGNRRAGPRESPVEDLIAEGPGTLSPAPNQFSKGKGVRTRDGWMVVLRRPAPHGVAPRSRTQVAFAIWEGSHGEAGARKMRTGWIPLLIEARTR